MRDTVLVLPCTPGAKVGNYFTSPNWRYADHLLRRAGLRDRVLFAAVEHMIVRFNPQNDRDELGALVTEEEMWRIAGYDEFPSLNLFLKTPGLYASLVRYLQIAIRRLRREGYSKFYIAVWPAAYQAAIHDAVYKISNKWPGWAAMALVPPLTMYARHSIRMAVWAMVNDVLGVRFTVQRLHGKWKKFWSRRASDFNTFITCDEVLSDDVVSWEPAPRNSLARWL